MYGPRFAKNLLTTIRNLMKCSVGDEEKIMRVLGLWQSKQIFSDDITKAAFTLAREVSEQNKAADESLKQVLIADCKDTNFNLNNFKIEN